METRTRTRTRTDRQWWILAVLCLSVLLTVVDNTIVNVALPTISRNLHASTSALQWIVDGYTLAFAGLLLVGGNLGDRLGRKRFLQLGLALFGVTSIVAALATSSGELIAARAAMGVSAALIYPATLAILNNVFTNPRERVTAIGIWSAVSGLAVAIGPVSGGALLRHFSWSSVFYVNVPVVLIALVAGRMLLPESRDPKAGRFDPLGAILSVAGITLLTWSIIEAPRHGWLSVATLGGSARRAARSRWRSSDCSASSSWSPSTSRWSAATTRSTPASRRCRSRWSPPRSRRSR
jgi:MFS transporter, DHA2 family, multidrug resistance protein